MSKMQLTPEIIHAAATDAGNASMRFRNLTTWDEKAYDACVTESTRLYKVYDVKGGEQQ